MAQGSQPGVWTGLLREDQANNGTAPAFSQGLPVDVWRHAQQALDGVVTQNDDDSWQQRVAVDQAQGS